MSEDVKPYFLICIHFKDIIYFIEIHIQIFVSFSLLFYEYIFVYICIEITEFVFYLLLLFLTVVFSCHLLSTLSCKICMEFAL